MDKLLNFCVICLKENNPLCTYIRILNRYYLKIYWQRKACLFTKCSNVFVLTIALYVVRHRGCECCIQYCRQWRRPRNIPWRRWLFSLVSLFTHCNSKTKNHYHVQIILFIKLPFYFVVLRTKFMFDCAIVKLLTEFFCRILICYLNIKTMKLKE